MPIESSNAAIFSLRHSAHPACSKLTKLTKAELASKLFWPCSNENRKIRLCSKRNQLPAGVQNCSRSMLRKKKRRKALLMVFANDGLRKSSSHSDSSCRLRQPEDRRITLPSPGRSFAGHTRMDTPHAGIIFLGPVDPAELAETLDAAPRDAEPGEPAGRFQFAI